jgi:allantoin racemase
MDLLVINPNSTASMTESIADAARAVAAADTTITAMNPQGRPAAIQGPEDGAAALPGLFALFDREVVGRSGYDAVIIACFDDTGLWALKARSPVPVIGIGEAAFHAAMLVAAKFSVVTTLAVSVPVIERNLAAYGFARRCARVRASGVLVLALGDGDSEALIAEEIAMAVGEDEAAAVVLGCAGMAGLAETMTRRFGLPVIDGVAAAVAFAEALHHARIGNGRHAARASMGA